ncbi:transcriptional regulator, partial [Burkholderia multivorans]
LGRSLREPVATLRRWAELNAAAITDNREREESAAGR